MGEKIEKQEGTQTIIGIVLLYVMISGTFSLLNKLTTFFIQGFSGKSIYSFFLRDGLWVIVIVTIIVIFIRKIGNMRHELKAEEFKKRILLSVSVLVIVTGIINFSGILPLYIINDIQNLQLSQQIRKDLGAIFDKTLITHIFSVVIMLGQVFFGILLLRYSKSQHKA